MVRGHTDYLDWPGRAGGGERVVAYSFSAAIGAGVTGTFNLPIVAVGQENLYQNIVVSCPDDTAIHNVIMTRVADAWLFFYQDFVTGGIFDFPGQTFAAGTTVRVSITNNAVGAVTFSGAVFYVIRPV